MKKWLIGLALIAASVVFFGSSFGDGQSSQADHEETALSKQPRPALSVRVTFPEQTKLPIQVKAYGDIAAWQEIVVSSEAMDLRLTEVLVDVGDQVEKGQVLATFDTQSVKADVEQARASLVEAKAVYTEAQENAKRIRALKNTGALSEQSIAEYNRAEKTALARVGVAQAALDAQKVRLQNAAIKAPDDGVISSRSAVVGAVTGIGGELFRMVRQNRLEWRAELMSDELGKIKPGTSAELILPDGQRVQGSVRVVAPTVDNKTRVGLIYVDLAENASVRSGMFAHGVFDLGESQTLAVPLQSIVTRDAFNYIFVLENDGRVRQTKITTGRRAGNLVEVLSGANSNDKIVTSGAGFLNDQDLVHVVEETKEINQTTYDEQPVSKGM